MAKETIEWLDDREQHRVLPPKNTTEGERLACRKGGRTGTLGGDSQPWHPMGHRRCFMCQHVFAEKDARRA